MVVYIEVYFCSNNVVVLLFVYIACIVRILFFAMPYIFLVSFIIDSVYSFSSCCECIELILLIIIKNIFDEVCITMIQYSSQLESLEH